VNLQVVGQEAALTAVAAVILIQTISKVRIKGPLQPPKVIEMNKSSLLLTDIMFWTKFFNQLGA